MKRSKAKTKTTAPTVDSSSQPAATMQVCGLSDPRMRIEIEVTAHKD